MILRPTNISSFVVSTTVSEHVVDHVVTYFRPWDRPQLDVFYNVIMTCESHVIVVCILQSNCCPQYFTNVTFFAGNVTMITRVKVAVYYVKEKDVDSAAVRRAILCSTVCGSLTFPCLPLYT